MRHCKRHGEAEFAQYSAGKKGFRWQCKRCVGEAVTRRHQKIKRTLVAEAGGRCAICGYDRCMVSLQFHHVVPADKEFAVSTANGRSLAAFRREMRKCVLVCANCHGEIEAGLTPSPPPGARHGEPWSETAGGGDGGRDGPAGVTAAAPEQAATQLGLDAPSAE